MSQSPPPPTTTTTSTSLQHIATGTKQQPAPSPDLDPVPATTASPRFSPAEEAALLSESNSLKASANALFNKTQFSEAIGAYDRALASCPNYLNYEIAVLKSNIAACHLKLREWKEAVDAATSALEGLERERKGKELDDGDGKDGAVVEIEDDNEVDMDEQLRRLQISDQRKAQIESLLAKSLLRRAKANTELGGWGALTSAEEGQFSFLSILFLIKKYEKKKE
jgi:tetratricopeptide (TPR) repeat protein